MSPQTASAQEGAHPVWEYVTVPLITHATKQILDQWGSDGWELVTVLPGPTGESHIAYLKRKKQ